MSLIAEMKREVGYPRWKHHASHALLGLSVALVGHVLLGFDMLNAAVLGGVAVPVFIELAHLKQFFYDRAKKVPTAYIRDVVGDLLTYQPVWVALALEAGDFGAALALSLIIGTGYLLLVSWMRP